MAIRSIASLSLSFGLVSIPIKLFSATESSAAIRFKLMASSGARVRQQYVAEEFPPAVKQMRAIHARAPEMERAAAKPRGHDLAPFKSAPPVESAAEEPVAEESWVERSTMLKGYEYEKGKFVLFTPEELKALEAGSRQTIDIVSFIPEEAVDPIYFDKAYFLAPDQGGAKPYNLLLRAMRDTGRCGLAKWAFRSKEYVVQIRAADGGIVLQQLFYAEEVRSFEELRMESAVVGDKELELAKRLIEQISSDVYDPTQFADEEKQRILAAVAQKIAGKQMAVPEHASSAYQVVNLLEALRASLQAKQGGGAWPAAGQARAERKPAKRVSSKAAQGARASNTRRFRAKPLAR